MEDSVSARLGITGSKQRTQRHSYFCYYEELENNFHIGQISIENYKLKKSLSEITELRVVFVCCHRQGLSGWAAIVFYELYD